MTHTIFALRAMLLIFGSIIVIDCLYLFSLKKFNFGTVVPLCIGIVFCVQAVCWQYIHNLIQQHHTLKLICITGWTAFVIWFFSFIIFVGTIQTKINAQTVDNSLKVIMVLGAGVNGDKPSPALASRLDTASKVWHKDPTAMIVTTGGVGFNRTHSEAYVMAKYLTEHHNINPQHVIQEGNSTSTEENFALSKPLLAQHKIDIKTHSIAIVTNDFHIVRAKAIANKQGYTNVRTVASTTPLNIKANAWFREYFAYVSGWLLREY